VKKVDVTEKGGQFSLQIATHSTIVTRPITWFSVVADVAPN
jgi:hypothetical protein